MTTNNEHRVQLCDRCGRDIASVLFSGPQGPERVVMVHSANAERPPLCVDCLLAAFGPGAKEAMIASLAQQQIREETQRAARAAMRSRIPDPRSEQLCINLLRHAAAHPLDVAGVQAALISLLAFLASAEGHQHENLVAVSELLNHGDRWEGLGIPPDVWMDVPDPIYDLVTQLIPLPEAFELPVDLQVSSATPQSLLVEARALTFGPAVT